MMNGLRNAKTWATVAAVVALTAVTSAQQPAGPSAPPPQALQVDQYKVGQAKPPETPGAPIKDLTLEQAIQIALEKNLDLQTAKTGPMIQDYTLTGQRATYLPNITGSFSQRRSSSTSTNALDGVATTNISASQSYNTGISQNLPWFGSNYSVSFSNGRSTSNSLNSTRNPSYSTGLSLSFSQPLLGANNFKMDSNRNNLRTAVIQKEIADITLQNVVESTKASVRTSYWSLRRAIESIEIQQRSLELAKRQYTDSQLRVDIGTLAPIEITNFEVAVASSNQALLNAQITWRTAELSFKRLLVSGADDELYRMTINPIDMPTFAVQNVDINGAIKTALAQRSDIEASRKNLRISELNLELTRAATSPTLSMSAGYSLSGTGGNQFSRGELVKPGGYFDALSSLTSFNTPTWNVGLNFSYPLGMASQKANLARAELQLDSSKSAIKAQELTITLDLTQAGLNVQNTYLQLQSSQLSRQAQERNADAVQTRFTAGLATPFEVAQALQSLTSARLNELNAIIAYVNAIADFEKKQRVAG
jgi:outer membrane protein TolC